MKKILIKAFDKIIKSETIDDLRSIWVDELKDKKYPQSKYPDFNIKISKSEIEELINSNILNSDLEITKYFLHGETNPTTLEKLLIALIWKNGDINKIKHIVSGIENKPLESTTAKVFTQFGKYLSNKDEPIIDQHTMRAYKYFVEKIELEDLNKSRTINNSDLKYIESYKNWLNKRAKEIKQDQRVQVVREIDKLMFTMGKLIKKIE